MYNNNQKYDAATRSTTRVKGEDGYWEYTFISEKGIFKYKTKDQKLANFIDSYPEKTFGIVTKGDKLVKAYEYENLFGQVRFSTALYVDSINSSIISQKATRDDITVHYVDCQGLAEHEVGNAKTQNMVMLGAIINATKVVNIDTMEKVFEKVFTGKKAKLIPKNMEALGVWKPEA
jgi:Pyruvate/2-oxoacid:ferredoxin oxidoreductase gamma subunit